MGNRFPHLLRIVGVIMITLVMLRGGTVSGGPPPHQTGSYNLTFGGYFTGMGNGAVGAQSVSINAKVKDPNGDEVHIVIANIHIEASRISGTFSVAGGTMAVQGRLEAAGGAVRANRLVITYQYNEDG